MSKRKINVSIKSKVFSVFLAYPPTGQFMVSTNMVPDNNSTTSNYIRFINLT